MGLIVSADEHLVEPEEFWNDWLPQSLPAHERDRAPRVEAYWDRQDPLHRDGGVGERYADLVERVRQFLHQAREWPRFQTLHFHGSFWPHNAGLNVLNVEANMPEAVFNELKARGHNAQKIPAYGMNGCATAVIVDPATSSRMAGGERRRDCYAIAY